MTHRSPKLSRFRFAFALLAALLLAALPLAAQPGHGGGHGGDHSYGAAEAGFGHHGARHLGRLARHLDLTEQQKASAKEIFDAAMAQAEPVRDALRQNHEDLRALLDAEVPDATAIGNLVIASHEARAQLKAIHEAAFADFKELLTGEQLEKLEEMKENRGERRHRRGKRGHRGHGGDSGSDEG